MPVDAASAGRGRPAAIALRTRLLAAILLPLLVAAVGLGAAGAALVNDVVRRTNDRVLGGSLGAIAEEVRVENGSVTLELPPAAFGMLENTERDNVYYRLAVGPELLTGYPDLPAPALDSLAWEEPHFRFATYRGQDIRIAEVKRHLPRIAQPVVVQVAETLENRRALVRQLTGALLLGELVLLGLTTLLVRPALGWSLRPLARLRVAVAQRDTRAVPDLSPLDTGPLPLELRPLADAFDHLLARLDDATEGVRRFTADASHQMRTPLSVLKVQVALARRGDEAARAEALGEIADAVDRLERLLTQLLALARAQEQGAAPPGESVDLRELAVAVINRHVGQAIEGGIDLNLDAPAGDPIRAISHRPLLFEIVSNLVDNAIRYNRPGGMVAIVLAETDGRIELAVADDGSGIPEGDLPRIADRFVRLRTDREGSGLGLAIVQSAATRLGLTLRLENTRPGLRATLAF